MAGGIALVRYTMRGKKLQILCPIFPSQMFSFCMRRITYDYYDYMYIQTYRDLYRYI